MKLTKRMRKLLAGVLLTFVLLTGFSCQQQRIRVLEEQANIKQEQQVEKTETKMYKDTIRNKFNEMQSYQVEEGKINFKHDFTYEKKAKFSTHKVNISAFGDVYYAYNVDLKDASVVETEDTITIYLPEAYLDKESLHVEQDSLQFVDSKTYSSFFADKEDNREAMKQFITSFEKQAAVKIDKYYKEEVKNHMPYQAKKQVKKLVGSFVHDKEIIVEVK